MTFGFWTKLVGVAHGDDLHIAVVSRTPFGVRAQPGPRLANFLQMPTDEVRTALADIASPSTPTTLVAPSAWCAVRSVQIVAKEWRNAREEIVRSIDSLVPIAPGEAMVGYLETVDGAGEPRGGAVIAMRTTHVAPWLEALERAGSRRVEVVTPHIAALGLGLQHDARAEVIDAAGAALVRHEFAHGRALSIAQPMHAGQTEPSSRYILPAAQGIYPKDAPGKQLSEFDLALGAALAPTVAGGVFSPIVGRDPAAPKRWLASVAAGVAAVILLAAAGPLLGARLARATDALQTDREQMAGEVEQIVRMRTDAERYSRLLSEGVAQPTSEWRSVLPALIDAQAALGAEGFLYRIEVTPDHLTMQGEAESASETLEQLEGSPSLAGARHMRPVRTSGVTNKQIFEIRAGREGGAP